MLYFLLHSELFGGEDQDYRPTDSKGLPLKSPSSKGWDKFKADHPDQYAYDIELKRQRSESMDVDQRYGTCSKINGCISEEQYQITDHVMMPDKCKIMHTRKI